MIPELDEHGLLPPGIHDCRFPEIEERFGWTTRRQELLAGLLRFFTTEVEPLGFPCRLYVDGSFVRNKPIPEDIDVVIEIDPSVPDQEAILLAFGLQLKEHARLRADYNVDVWVRHPSLPNNLIEFFQYLGDKAAAALRLPAKHPKGILRITP